MKKSVLVGKVCMFDQHSGNGVVVVDGNDFLQFSMKGCHRIEAGTNEPEPVGHLSRWPKVNEELAIFETRGMLAFTWGYKNFYDSAAKEIAERPHFRVLAVHEQRRGEFIRSLNPVVAEGTTKELVNQFPRFQGNDPLGSHCYHAPLGFSRRNQWQRGKGDEWVNCVDPRPRPAGSVFQCLEVRGATSIKELARGTAYELWEKFPIGNGDQLAPIEPDKGFRFWQREEFDGTVVEVSDPRLPRPVVQKQKTVSVSAPPAMDPILARFRQKYGEPRPRSSADLVTA